MGTSDWLKIFGAFICLLIFVLIPFLFYSLAFDDPYEVELDKIYATNLIQEFENYKKINEMDDCKRNIKSLNGIQIRMNKIPLDREIGRYYKDVLKEQKIDELDFERFRKKLEKSKLRSYYRTEKYSIFIVDGFLDSVWGYLYSHSHTENEIDNLRANNYTIRSTENLGDGWFRIGGS